MFILVEATLEERGEPPYLSLYVIMGQLNVIVINFSSNFLQPYQEA